MCTSISKGPTLSILQPTPKLRMQFSEQQCYVGCILIPCIDKVGPFEMDVHKYALFVACSFQLHFWNWKLNVVYYISSRQEGPRRPSCLLYSFFFQIVSNDPKSLRWNRSTVCFSKVSTPLSVLGLLSLLPSHQWRKGPFARVWFYLTCVRCLSFWSDEDSRITLYRDDLCIVPRHLTTPAYIIKFLRKDGTAVG